MECLWEGGGEYKAVYLEGWCPEADTVWISIGENTPVAGWYRILDGASDRPTLPVSLGPFLESVLGILLLLIHSPQAGHSVAGKTDAADLMM